MIAADFHQFDLRVTTIRSKRLWVSLCDWEGGGLSGEFESIVDCGTVHERGHASERECKVSDRKVWYQYVSYIAINLMGNQDFECIDMFIMQAPWQ